MQTVELEPAQIANGAVELLGEVSKSKITGEEERYSHTDLVDFEANVDGAKAAFDARAAGRSPQSDPALGESDRRSASTTSTRRSSRYRQGDGFVSYTRADERRHARARRSIDALAEPLSQVRCARRRGRR